MADIASIRLSELTGRINQVLKGAFHQQSFWVVADITNYSFQQNKRYHYFDLVEKDPLSNLILARVPAAAWSAGAAKIDEFERVTGQKFQNDLHVLVQVSVDYHPVFGLKLVVVNIDPAFSLGLLEKARQETLRRLLSECSDFISWSGTEYITRNKQLALPSVIQRVALVTSESSAAIQDFKHTLLHNRFNYRFVLHDYFTLVQGETNAQAFYKKLLEVFHSGIQYDVVVIIRGGGAQTDFLLFDQFILGKIVAKFPIPVITGIGHQKDETIVDLMAHTSTKTPTQAAEFIVSHNRSFEEILIAEKKSIIIRVQQALAGHRHELHRVNNTVLNKSRTLLYMHTHMLTHFTRQTITQSRVLLNKQATALYLSYKTLAFHPRALVTGKAGELKSLAGTISSFSRLFFNRQKDQLQSYETLTRVMSPVNILRKGFALIYQEDRIVSDPDKIPVGGRIQVRLADTLFDSTVNAKNKTNGEEPNV
jgi:exodeoxyribonuclease VII large subunit